MPDVAQHPYLSIQDSRKQKMSKYLLLSLLLHAVIIILISIDPVREIFIQEIELKNLSQATIPTLQIIMEKPVEIPPIEKQVVYTDTSNATEEQVADTSFESEHNTRLTSVEAPTLEPPNMLPQQTGDPNMGLSISQQDGRTNIPTPPPQPQAQPSNIKPTPTPPAESPTIELTQNESDLIIEGQVDEATLIEEREAMRRASKQEALKQAQAKKQKETPQEIQEEALPDRLRRPAQDRIERPRSVEEPRPAPEIVRARSNIQGGGERGDTTSIGSRATPVGRYKSMLYQEVGSRWNQEIDRRGGPSMLPLGSVRIAFTVKYNGEITDIRVVSRSASNNIIALENLCLYAIRSTSPFEPFDKAVREQLGDSFREEFTFTIYR